MIKLFEKNQKEFNKNSIATIQPLKVIETKQSSLNGWEIQATISSRDVDLIDEGMIAYIETKSKKGQPFVIRNITKHERTATFNASHVVFESSNYILEDVRPTNMSAGGALNYVNQRTDITSPFTTTSSVSNSETAYFIRRTLLEALTTIENRWGGQYDIDKYHINLKDTIGTNRGYSIRYGKNLQGITVFEDWSEVVTKLLPVGYDGITLPETYLYSDKDYDKPYTKIVKFETELEPDEETNEYDQQELIQELRENAQKYLEENEVPKVSYEVVSDVNEEMDIGDTIQVVHPVVGNLETKVISYEYNPITKRTTKLVFGNYVRSVKSKVDRIKTEIDRVFEKTSGLESILTSQTDIINNMNKNGHVYIDDNQILILDALPKSQANHVWRWNMGGLAFSENGVEGPFKQAWTMDGTFNTEFIAANSIMTNQLHSDVGSSLDLSSNESVNILVENANFSSILINANGENDNYTFWEDYGENDNLRNYSDLMVGYENMTNYTIFEIVENNRSLSPQNISFFGNGKTMNGLFRVLNEYKYSYKAKRFAGVQSLTIEVHEFDSDQIFIKKTDYVFNDDIEINQMDLDSNTEHIGLAYVISGVSWENRLEIGEIMFNIGSPKPYVENIDSVKAWAESQFQITAHDIQLIQSDINNTIVKITGEKGVEIWNDNGKGLTVYDDNNEPSIELNSSGHLIARDATISGEIYAKSGEIGNFRLIAGVLRLIDEQRDLRIALGGKSTTGADLPVWIGNSYGVDPIFFVNKNSEQVFVGRNLRMSSAPGINRSAIWINSDYESTGYFDYLRPFTNNYIVVRDELRFEFAGHLKIKDINSNYHSPIASVTGGGFRGSFRQLVPDYGAGANIGTSNNRYDVIYLNLQPNVSSDARQKFAIQDIPQDLIVVLTEIKPKMYLQGDKWHFGYIAQDVERALFKWATKRYGREAKHYVDKFAMLHKDDSFMSLLYGELNVLKERQMQTKLSELEKRLEALENADRR